MKNIRKLYMEIWKDVKNYEGYYQVSNYGRVRSIDRIEKQKHYSGVMSTYIHKGKLLKLRKYKNNYMYAYLNKNGSQKKYLVHRLVATAFLENENNYKYINHKDNNPNNNNVDNLEWCTQKYNIQYAYDNGTKTPPNMKSVRQLKDNKTIAEYNSLTEAQRETGVCWTNISKCCRKLRSHAGGYQWEYIM